MSKLINLLFFVNKKSPTKVGHGGTITLIVSGCALRRQVVGFQKLC